MATGAHKLVAPTPVTVQAHITIYDAHHRTRLPGTVAPNPDSSNDPEAKEAFAGLLATFNLYWEVFKRNSIDDHGMPLVGSVHQHPAVTVLIIQRPRVEDFMLLDNVSEPLVQRYDRPLEIAALIIESDRRVHHEQNVVRASSESTI